MKSSEQQARRQSISITPDTARVLLRPFIPGKAGRMKSILRRIMKVSDAQAKQVLDSIMPEFQHRHRDVRAFFAQRFDQLKPLLPSKFKATEAKRLLIGSYFTCEYSLESAALFNPSIVLHPDQSRLESGSIRFIMSLRATGEGHISSIEFRTGIIDKKDEVSIDPPGRYVSSPEEYPDPVFTKPEIIMKLQDERALTPATKEILRPLSSEFKRSQLVARIERFRNGHRKLTSVQRRSIGHAEALADLNYEIRFSKALQLSERAIFPLSLYEKNGIEDARFVKFTEENGSVTYYATYTAYNGKQIKPLLLETTDFTHFRIRSLSGAAAKNKGMALFPRRICGKFAMITRHDAEILYFALSDDISRWNSPVKLLVPTHEWELTQIGNCGSPLETEKGWILLTHGVGPVRKYCIGAILLDRDNPAKVIGQLRHPLIAPDESEREGYVPNVVYTCGAILHDRTLIIPYAMSDTMTRIASIGIDELLGRMQ
jgi:predicted GH43/DUF377 family glycosyl hydrolase